MKYWTIDREAGNRIDCFDTKDKAMEAIERYEQEDQEDNTYEPNFYGVEEEPEDMSDYFTKGDAIEFVNQLQEYIDNGGDNAVKAQKTIYGLERDMGIKTWKKTCPICGSRHTDRFEDAYWGMCRECGFNSMASESLEQAMEAWNNGYLDIEDKAKHEGISKFTHDELLDLWWYEVGMDGCVDMGMQPEEIDEFWDTHPDDLKEEVNLMWSRIRQFV